ncbi:glycosyltransferase [Kineococcus aurantiacus]|uniref:Glycosyltransferase involved in cell wall biosynthesis/GT2 family glycosyltransferase n=1 Tax=Kineococcus aurantiacus TaxID=37633 RepID=A0A7Y9ASD3_9ACTN|nr:glycosyltransferase involved in cell wall biosynthesis/GT2 family glycosyltransferase [Kineococcus aurantiacus]
MPGAVRAVPRPGGPGTPARSGLPRIATVVCTLGARPGLRDLVVDLLAQELPHRAEHQVVVVDNDPASGAVRAQLGDLPGVRVLAEPRRGLARARNRAVDDLDVDVIAFTDDDCAVAPGWLAALTAPLCGPAAHPAVGCVTGLTVALDPASRAEELFEEFGSFTRGDHRCCWTPDGSTPPPELGEPGVRPSFFPYSGVFGSGNNMAFTVDALRRIGGFPPSLGAGTAVGGGEDLFAFLRVLEVGLAVVYEPAAQVTHRHRDEMGALRAQVRSYGSGLAAMVLHHVVTRPAAAPELLRALPSGVRHLLDPGSAKNARRSDSFPRDLALAELLGVAEAPLLYARARWQARSAATPPPVRTGLRVLVPTDAMAPLGGVEVSTLEVGEELAARGHELVVFAAAGGPQAPRWGRAAARVVRTPALTVPVRAPWRAVRLVGPVLAARRARPDVIWLNRAEQLLFGALAGWASGAPVVCQLRHGPFAGPAVRALRGRATRYLAVSGAVLGDWVRAGLDPRRIDVVHNGVDVRRYPPATAAQRAAARLSLGIGADTEVVLHYGRLTADKGLHVLRAALPLLRTRRAARGGDVLLLLVGDQPPAERDGRVGDTPGVRHLPARSGEDLLAVLAAADVVALPALTPEPFGRVVVEGMAAGLPVVASRTGGIPEILTGEFARWLVTPGDPADLARALDHALDATHEDRDLGRRAREHVARRFPLSATADAVEAALTDAAVPAGRATARDRPVRPVPAQPGPQPDTASRHPHRTSQEVESR